MKEKLKILDWIRQRTKTTGDSEPEQASLRLIIGIMLVSYFCLPWAEGETFKQAIGSVASLVTIGYYTGALAIAVAILIHPKQSQARRIAGIFLDMTSLSVVMFLAGSESVFLFVLYLWVILGNGFRYGLKYLYISLIVAVLGFSSAITWGSYWQTHQSEPIALSLLFLLILIPAYSSFLIKKLHAAIASAKQANDAKSRFLANMSHELRTPLNGVIGMGDLLRETKLDKEQREFINTMHSSAHTLLELIEKVLDISKIEAGKITITHRQIDLHALVNSVLSMQVPIGAVKGITVSCTIDSDVPFLLEGDQPHIRQILINLIGNAIKFTDQGSVKLHIFQIESDEESVILRFEVKDTGIGIDEHLLPTVFDDFTQVGSTERTVGGTGLGTTISKELVELMGGKIGVESKLHQGSTFWFELPFTIAFNTSQDISDKHMLVMSSESSTAVIKPILHGWNIEFDLVKSPIHALKMLTRAIDESDGYKVLLVDQQSLGDISPVQFAEMLKADRLLNGLSLVLITSTNTTIYDDEIGQYYISIIDEITDKRLLFNAIHAAQSIRLNGDNVISISEHYASQVGAKPLNILVAEDNKVNQQVIEGILKRAGHTVLVADTGEKALDILDEELDQIDLLIVDKNMPERSGDEVVQALRYMDTQKELPVIMLTADATPEAREVSINIGVNAFLTKPIDSFALLEKIAFLSNQEFSPAQNRNYGQAALTTSLKEDNADVKKDSIKDNEWFDEHVFHQLAMLDRDPAFIRRLINGFVQDGEKHIAGIKNSISHDYLEFRESLHALKGSATELGAKRLAEICLRGEQHKPYDIGTEKLVQLGNDIEMIYQNTATALDIAVSNAEKNSRD
ncbi:MAG: ATP-binding protein [Gammaproteobacteria bacterium]|nr:ATP-binding protein [Gammaproteobacteria bacterium]MDH5591400.1 ATP-binding protein [Gammaproteobacteria bacterium]